jgi:hypothetical protein
MKLEWLKSKEISFKKAESKINPSHPYTLKKTLSGQKILSQNGATIFLMYEWSFL